MAPGECAERERREDAERAVQVAGERAVRQREADREEEVLEELHLPPEAPRGRDEAARRRVQTRIGELVLRLVAANRGRHHRDRLGGEHRGADEQQRPGGAEPPAVDRAQRANEDPAAECHDHDADTGDRNRAERVERGEPEARRRRDAEPRRHTRDEPVRLVGGQRADDAQTEEPAGRGRGEHEDEQPEVDHRVLRTPTYPSQ